MLRGGPLLFPRWPTGDGWGGGHGSLDIETSGEPRRRWPPYLSISLLLPPGASAASAFYFHSTLSGQERRRRARGCLGFWTRSSDPRQVEGRQALKAHTPYSPNTPEHFRPRRDVHTRTLALRDARTESLDVSLPRLSRGTLYSQRRTHSSTQMPALLLLPNIFPVLLTQTRTHLCTCISAHSCGCGGRPQPGDLGHADTDMCTYSNVARHSGTQHLPHFQAVWLSIVIFPFPSHR